MATLRAPDTTLSDEPQASACAAPRGLKPAARAVLLPAPGEAGGFTLVEMLVSLAVLALALSVVGVVFSVTTRAASQSAAYSETHNWVRQWMQQIEEDLAHCDPTSSILVLVGWTQAAALTQDDLVAGKYYRVLVGNPALVPPNYDPEFATFAHPQYSDPRADILMFFSNRPTVSQAPALNAGSDDPYAGGVKFAPILVVYGHAALGDASWNGAIYQFPDEATLRHIYDPNLSPIPANRWHLGRRATITVPSDPPAAKYAFNNTEIDRIRLCAPTTTDPGDVAVLDLAVYLGGLYFDLAAGYPALYSPYTFMADVGSPAVTDRISWLLYKNGTPGNNHHVATVLEEVPVGLKTNLGVHMLPGCVWFQVEFLMPEDPRNSVEYSPDPSAGVPSKRYDMPRWTSVARGETYVFVPDTQENRNVVALDPTTGFPSDRLWTFGRLDQNAANDPNIDPIGNRIIRMWPYAIRVTVRVFDSRGRLEQPIVRSIVHRFE